MPSTKVFILSALLGVSACCPHDQITTKPAIPSITIPARPRTTQFEPVSISIVTKENLSDLQLQVSKASDTTFIVFTPQSYENLLANIGELKRYNEQSDILVNYYEQTIKAITSDNPTSKSTK